MRIFYLLLFFFTFFLPSNAQKVLQMEKFGKVEATKFYMGDDITFRLKGSKKWHRETLMDVKIKEDIIIFPNRYVNVRDITAIKTFKTARLANNVEKGMYTFGASWLLFSLGATLFDEPLTSDAITVPAVAVAFGFLFKKIFYSKKHKIGKRKRLRVLDISFNNEMRYNVP